eukprot:TRINITY_DN233_c1_g1_i3.p1 TRINITY_DN233_c1_g1~~TRINITY_DN233_c1_g1_i3.p1  ORF type:complete len:676 (-),score=234.22 TRINITY_DN233_c1_g1_i3:219-2246(-)
MKKCSALVLLATTAAGSNVTPVQKVIQLMEGMTKKGKEEKAAEAAQYAEFNKFCELTLVDKQRAISKALQTEDELAATIEKASSDASRLANEVQGHSSDLGKNKEEQSEATELREKERADFQTTLTDYTESIDAVGRAMKALKEQNFDRAQAKKSFLQLSSSRLMPKEMLDSLDTLLLETSATSTGSQPKAAGYKFQSSGVISMLEGLQNKFLDERTELEKTETSKKQAYDLLMQGLKAQEANDEKQKAEKTEFKAKKLQAVGDAKGDLAETKTAREADQKYRSDLDITCKKKSTDFAARQKLRQEELEAIAKATEIISSGAVSGASEKHLPALLQLKSSSSSSSSSLANLRTSTSFEGTKKDVVQFLQSEAKNLNSKVLSALVTQLGAPDVSFINDIKRMVENLIVKLNKQASADADKKAYCDKEMKTNEQTRTEKSETVESLQAEIDELTASNSKLDRDVKECGEDITKLNTAMSEATGIRQKEKAKNTQTIKDAVTAQAAVGQAITVLRDFYDDASYSTSLVQKANQQPEAPEVFGDEAYTGMSSANGGVVGMMEVIESDFARLEAETTAAEAAAKKEYDEFMEDSQVDKQRKSAEVDHKSGKLAEQTQELASTKTDIDATQKELDAALAYFEKLKPDCVDAGASYEERKKQREEEINDLQKALDKLGAGEA